MIKWFDIWSVLGILYTQFKYIVLWLDDEIKDLSCIFCILYYIIIVYYIIVYYIILYTYIISDIFAISSEKAFRES